MYPSIPCAGEVPTASADSQDGGLLPDAAVDSSDAGTNGLDGGLECPAPEPEGPELVPDATQCLPYPDPAQGREFGSGINADFDVACDPALLLCVLAGEPPSLR